MTIGGTWAGSTAYAVLESFARPVAKAKEKRVKGITGSTRRVCPIIIGPALIQRTGISQEATRPAWRLTQKHLRNRGTDRQCGRLISKGAEDSGRKRGKETGVRTRARRP